MLSSPQSEYPCLLDRILGPSALLSARPVKKKPEDPGKGAPTNPASGKGPLPAEAAPDIRQAAFADPLPRKKQPLVMTPADYRRAVLRDLKWLLNSPQSLRPDRCATWGDREDATPHDRDDNLRTSNNPHGYLFPLVRKSVVNYGARSLAGTLNQGADTVEMERDLKETIINFEPRLIAETVSVRLSPEHIKAGILAFEVSAQLWALPHPEPLIFRSEFDLESGGCRIHEKL